MRALHACSKYILAGAFALAALAPADTAHARFHVLYSFTGGNDGAAPVGGLNKDSAGNLYGTTEYGGTSQAGTVFKLAPDGTETVLHAFTGGSDGAYPTASLIKDSAGNLYGTAQGGGVANCGGGVGCGTVFKVAPDGTETVLHAFAGGDGEFPAAGLLRDKAGNLFGTTPYGGTNNFGTVFKVAPNGNESVLHSFGGANDGFSPYSDLIKDVAGDLYGTTYGGGGGSCGTVFKVDPHGTETVHYAFTGGNDGCGPEAGLIKDSAGNFYGTTTQGGGFTCSGNSGCGTVFEIAPDGTERVLHAFAGGSDGEWPAAGVIMDGAGYLYGTTIDGGNDNCKDHFSGCGAIFKLAPDGTETVLYTFCSQQICADGLYPHAGPIKGGTGDLYGAAYEGGLGYGQGSGYGTIFKLRK